MLFISYVFSILSELHKYFIQGILSLIDFFRSQCWNKPHFVGSIDYYGSYNDKVFGSGKTLSAVKLVYDFYNKYQGKSFRDSSGLHLTNNIIVYSNISLSIPYIELHSLRQLQDFADTKRYGDVAIFLVDECNAVLNSRNFRDNLTTDVIQSIVTCRHNNIYLLLVGQRFNYLDALCRDMIDNVIECSYSSWFHCLTHRFYKGYEIQQGNKRLRSISASYVSSKYFSLYDSKGMVNSLSNDDSYKDKVVERLSQNSNMLLLTKRGLKRRRHSLHT